MNRSSVLSFGVVALIASFSTVACSSPGSDTAGAAAAPCSSGGASAVVADPVPSASSPVAINVDAPIFVDGRGQRDAGPAPEGDGGVDASANDAGGDAEVCTFVEVDDGKGGTVFTVSCHGP